jgi:hypothetical protein
MPTSVDSRHQLVEFRMTPVIVMEIDGVPKAVPDPFGTPEITIGCDRCDVGLSEALTNPHCSKAEEPNDDRRG